MPLNATLAPSGAHSLHALRVDLKGSSVGFAGVVVIVSFMVLFSFSFVPGSGLRVSGFGYSIFYIRYCLPAAGRDIFLFLPLLRRKLNLWLRFRFSVRR
jgi:hypothetical protein